MDPITQWLWLVLQGDSSMANDFDSSVKERLDSAANSIKRGDIVRGREGLERVLEQEPDNALAVLIARQKFGYALEQILHPGLSEDARDKLNALLPS